MKKIYLSIPYSFNTTLSFEIANRLTADLMLKGFAVFSPISHSHPVCRHMNHDLKLDHEFWMNQDLPWIDCVDTVLVVEIQGLNKSGRQLVEESRGVQAEIKRAIEKGKFIEYVQTDPSLIQEIYNQYL